MKVTATPILAALLLIQSCGGTFATSLRAILAASGPLIESLNLGDSKEKVIIGFTELTTSATTLADSLKACTDNPCKLNAVQAFKADYDRIRLRGIFGVHPKLQKVGQILDGIILSARLFYGAKMPQVSGTGGARTVTENDLDAQIKELKAAMKVQ